MRIITPTVQRERGKNEVYDVLTFYPSPLAPLWLGTESTVEQSLPLPSTKEGRLTLGNEASVRLAQTNWTTRAY